MSLSDTVSSPPLASARGGLLLIVLLLKFTVVSASALPAYAEKKWLQLLHIPAGSNQSELVSSEFFLSPQGRTNAKEELKATLQAFNTPFIPKHANSHPICKFPARYQWLSEQGLINLNINPNDSCPAYMAWAKPDDLQSVSLIQVTGYMGNPASTFGHVLLKINNNTTISDSTLLDQAVNYGAIVPDGENGILYTLFGLFGGYRAGFTTQEVYKENHIYLDKELRDMWEYQLNLNERQKLLLVSHLWELVGKEFDYYFIDENCGYHMGKLIELASDFDIIDNRPWHIPADIFHAISRHEELIASIKIIPSFDRVVNTRYKNLTLAGKSAFTSAIQGDESSYLQLSLSEAHKTSLAIADYYRYKSLEDEKTQYNQSQRNKWLLRAIQLPTSQYAPAKNYGLNPPTEGSPDSLFQFGIQSNSSQGGAATVGAAVSYHDAVSLKTGKQLDTEFIALNLALETSDTSLEFSHFTFVKVAKFITERSQILGSNKLSWMVDVGYLGKAYDSGVEGPYLTGGLGKSTYLRNTLLYSFLDLMLLPHDEENSHFGTKLRLGAQHSFSDKERVSIELSNTYQQEETPRPTLNVKYGYSVDKYYQLIVDHYNSHDHHQSSLSLRRHF